MKTLEEKKRILREYANIGTEIRQLLEQKERLKSNAEKITAGFDELGSRKTGKAGDKIQNYTDRIDELAEKYEKMVEQKTKLCEAVDAALLKLPQIERYILIERFVVGTKGWIVARVLGYEHSRFYDLERKALEDFEI